MKSLTIFCKSIEISLKTGIDICDITHQINRLVTESNIENGSLCAAVIGSTGSLTTIEFEPGVVEDLKKAINRIAPPDLEYEHAGIAT
jgi:thiamine phosphate synthase YjbQ (UPF0047 family)